LLETKIKLVSCNLGHPVYVLVVLVLMLLANDSCHDCSFLWKYFRWHSTRLHVPMNDRQWPIIYSPEYNITLCGIERMQAYDSCRSGNIFALLKGRYFCSYNLIANTVSTKLASVFNHTVIVEDSKHVFTAC